jgi:hypothetical protein
MERIKKGTIPVKSAFERWSEGEVDFVANVANVKHKWRHVSTPLYVFVKCKGTINLVFVSPCIIIHSNKSINQMHQSLRFIARCLNTAQHVSGILMPIIRNSTTAVAASGLPLERGGSSVVGRGRSDRTDHDMLVRPDRSRPTTLLPPRSNGKPDAATAVVEFLMMGVRMPETC